MARDQLGASRGAGAENVRANPHMRSAELGGDLKVAAHAHGKLLKTIAAGDFRQQREMRRGSLIRRRNAHEAVNDETERPALGDEGVGLARRDARLLFFLAGVDLNEKARRAGLPRHLCGERTRQFRPVEAFNGVEKRHRVLCLVRLEGADEMQFDARIFCLGRRPFALRFLHPVLAEKAMAGGKKRLDALGAMFFRYRNDADILALSAGFGCGLIETCGDPGEIGGGVV